MELYETLPKPKGRVLLQSFRTDGHTVRERRQTQTDRQTDRQINRQTDKQTDIERQTDI